MREPHQARRAYRGRLRLYPREFRERLGQSMEQTFADSLRERHADRRHSVPFIAWAFLETSIGIMKERGRRTRGVSLSSAVAALVVMVPFMALEWTTASDAPRGGFALPLFAYLWLLAMLFIRTSIAAVRVRLSIRTGQTATAKSVCLVPRVAFLGVTGSTWLSWVIDQMPCFLGATGCGRYKPGLDGIKDWAKRASNSRPGRYRAAMNPPGRRGRAPR